MKTSTLVSTALILLTSTLLRADPPATVPSATAPDAAAPAGLPTKIAMDDPAIRLVGRFDVHDPKAPACQWSGSTVELKFDSTAANVVWTAGEREQWQAIIDGKPGNVLKYHKGQKLYNIASGLSKGEHTLQLVRRTEAFTGISLFAGLQLDAGASVAPIPPRPHRIEVIGDSISCGYGNEGASNKEHFSPDTENAYMTYWAMAARQLDADAVCLAWSGKLMFPFDTVPEVYDRTLPFDPGSRWDFSRFTPDVIVITLGTNDWARKGMKDTAAWIKGYDAFVERLRTHYPKAELYLGKSPMLDGDGYATLNRCLEQVVADRAAAGDKRVHVLDFKPQDMKNGLGSDWHPSIKTHAIMAKVMVEAISKDLGWPVKAE